MNTYSQYKESGVPWIGDIPAGWKVNKFSRVAFFQEGPGLRNWQFTDEGVKVICVTNIVPPRISFDKYVKFISLEEYESTYKHFTVAKGDILIASSGASWGKVAEYNDDEIVILNTSTIRLNENNFSTISKSFLKWLIQSPYINEHLNFLLTGSCQPNFGPTHLKQLFCTYPPRREEQEFIANYLDCKTAEIDKLISKKQKLIELLEEERTALINQAVTKGIDPRAKMKPSGIEWLGEVPAHWEVWKISHAFKTIGSGTTPESGNNQYHENGTVNWINTGDLNDDKLLTCSKKVTEQALSDYSALKIYPSGSVVIAMYGATIGKVSFVEFEATVNQACCVFNHSTVITQEFLFFWFRAMKQHIINLAKGGGQPNISQDILRNIRIPCPTPNEQGSIVQYIKQEDSRLTKIIDKVLHEISLLNEYKTALISEVVTGKVDVRGEVDGKNERGLRMVAEETGKYAK